MKASFKVLTTASASIAAEEVDGRRTAARLQLC